MSEVAARPEIGRINTATHELVIALALDFISNVDSNSEIDVSLARRVEA